MIFGFVAGDWAGVSAAAICPDPVRGRGAGGGGRSAGAGAKAAASRVEVAPSGVATMPDRFALYGNNFESCVATSKCQGTALKKMPITIIVASKARQLDKDVNRRAL
jgi:hypothetical protein